MGDDYTVRIWFRFKVLLFLIAFASLFLIGSNVLKWPIRQLAYIGYPLYLLVMALGGVFTAPNDLLGYKIGLVGEEAHNALFEKIEGIRKETERVKRYASW